MGVSEGKTEQEQNDKHMAEEHLIGILARRTKNENELCGSPAKEGKKRY